MLLSKREMKAIFGDIIARLNKEKVHRKAALEQLFEERRRAYERARQLEIHRYSTAYGTLITALCFFESRRNKNPLYILPALPIFAYMIYVVDTIFNPKRDKVIELFDSIWSKGRDYVYVPVTLESIRQRGSDDLNEVV